jgi:phospholipase/carboxylesterase
MLNNNPPLLETIEINPTGNTTASIIWLHGLGADGNDFVPVIPELNLPENLPVRFVFPNAPMQPVTINNGYIMRSWYDIVMMDINKHADEKGIAESAQHIWRLIEREEQSGVPTERIMLAGFSQGAVMALTTGLTYPKKLAGILALSGYLPYSEQIMAKASPANKTTPIFLGHGTQDTVVPYFLGQAAHEALTQHQYNVAWYSYPMGHSVCIEEIEAIGTWIVQQLS